MKMNKTTCGRRRVRRALAIAVCVSSLTAQVAQRPEIPRVWDDAALADWATPLAGLNLRPTHMKSSEYYVLKIENLRTYPVYAPGREPEGYWKKLQELGPRPLIDSSELKTEADWISAGTRVFDEMDFLHLRTLDPKYINEVRNSPQGRVLPDGTIFGPRWVPTKQGVALTFSNCSFCHTMILPDGTRVAGAPFRTIAPRPGQTRPAPGLLARLQMEKGILAGGPPFFMEGEPIGMQLYRAYGVPWRKDDLNERLKSARQIDYEDLDFAARQGGITRWNGSPLFPAKVPDLIGIKDRKYIDHTATHLNRGIADIMRYAALVTSAEATEFGPHQMMGKNTRRTGLRVSDEALYALALYLYSLHRRLTRTPLERRLRRVRSYSAVSVLVVTCRHFTRATRSRSPMDLSRRRTSRHRSPFCRYRWAQTRVWPCGHEKVPAITKCLRLRDCGIEAGIFTTGQWRASKRCSTRGD